MQLDGYLRALVEAELEQPKEILVSVPGAGDALCDALDEAANELGCPTFQLHDDALITWVKPRGNLWDTHELLARFRSLSARFPALAFEVRLEPDGSVGTLRAGAFTEVPFDELERWVGAWPRPRHPSADVRGELRVRAAASELADIRRELERYELAIAVGEILGGLRVEIARTDHIAPVLRFVLGPLFASERWRCELALSGGISWRCEISDLAHSFALTDLIGTLLRDVPSPAEPAAPAIELPRAPQLVPLADGLALQRADFSLVGLDRDGGFVPVEPAPRFVAERCAIRWQGPERIERIDLVTGEVRDVHAAPAPYSRRPLGLVGDDLVLVETALQLGRIRSRLVVHARDGEERASRVLINASQPVIAGRDIAVTAEQDGRRELLRFDLATLSETVVSALGEAEPELIAHDGALLGLVTVRRDTELVRYPSSDRLAALDGVQHRLWRDGDALWLLADRIDADQKYTALLHRVSLADGASQTRVLGAARSDRTQIAGAWFAWLGFDHQAVEVYARGELRHRFAIPPGRRVLDFALSPTGVLAWMLDDHTLELRRGDERASVALPDYFAVWFNLAPSPA